MLPFCVNTAPEMPLNGFIDKCTTVIAKLNNYAENFPTMITEGVL